MKSLFIQALLFVALLTGCRLVYTTAEVQQNLKQAADEFAKNTTKARKEFQNFTSEYKSFQCVSTKSPFTEAERKMDELNSRIKELETLNNGVQKEYMNFLSYTKGKKELTSNSEEWDKLKATKKQYKQSISQYQEKSEMLQKEASAFQLFVTSNVSPAIQKCDVKSYSKKANDAFLASDKNAKTAITRIVNIEGQITHFILTNQTNQPELCNNIQRDWLAIRQQKDSVSAVINQLSKEIAQFTLDTQNKSIIYSCSSDWYIVENFEKKVKLLESDVSKINGTITQRIGTINALINPPDPPVKMN